jgi:hypothetical protein
VRAGVRGWGGYLVRTCRSCTSHGILGSYCGDREMLESLGQGAASGFKGSGDGSGTPLCPFLNLFSHSKFPTHLLRQNRKASVLRSLSQTIVSLPF